MAIVPDPIIRVCPEHLCKLFNASDIMERVEAQQLLSRIESKRKEKVFVDRNGNECWWTDLLFIIDPRFPVGHLEHMVAADINRHRTDDGVIGGSGRWDPGKSTLLIEGKLYARFRTRNGRVPRCYLCENGDMISPSERFYDSTYRPNPPEKAS